MTAIESQTLITDIAEALGLDFTIYTSEAEQDMLTIAHDMNQ